jgi:hypothetical protein
MHPRGVRVIDGQLDVCFHWQPNFPTIQQQWPAGARLDGHFPCSDLLSRPLFVGSRANCLGTRHGAEGRWWRHGINAVGTQPGAYLFLVVRPKNQPAASQFSDVCFRHEAGKDLGVRKNGLLLRALHHPQQAKRQLLPRCSRHGVARDIRMSRIDKQPERKGPATMTSSNWIPLDRWSFRDCSWRMQSSQMSFGTAAR